MINFPYLTYYLHYHIPESYSLYKGTTITPRIHPAYRSYFLGSVVLSSHSPPVTPFRAHFVHSPLRAVGEWNETEDVSGERTEHERLTQ